MILVSACLVGINCRYDGRNNLHPLLVQALVSGHLLPICPEQLGGLPTPRIPAEIQGGSGEDLFAQGPEVDLSQPSKVRVLDQAGKDRTSAFLMGAKEVADLAQKVGAHTAILKARSPSCGCGQIYNGSFSGQLKAGDGVTAALLKKIGINVFTEEHITPEFLNQIITKLK
ncbi:MAG: DUF523 domain-containing protein [Syntrophomonadaceae bacterium]|nr:DUF523 domain-containing protein [Syntrophomonadaceae bacterium]